MKMCYGIILQNNDNEIIIKAYHNYNYLNGLIEHCKLFIKC